jgi:isocitrate/isopropylmalate dehydrogenase
LYARREYKDINMDENKKTLSAASNSNCISGTSSKRQNGCEEINKLKKSRNLRMKIVGVLLIFLISTPHINNVHITLRMFYDIAIQH